MQLARIVNCITDQFNHKIHTGVLLLDIEKAFDNVWILGLIHKLIITADVPQGSVLGPRLFNLYVNDIPKSRETEIVLFVDGTTLFTSI